MTLVVGKQLQIVMYLIPIPLPCYKRFQSMHKPPENSPTKVLCSYSAAKWVTQSSFRPTLRYTHLPTAALRDIRARKNISVNKPVMVLQLTAVSNKEFALNKQCGPT